MKKEIMIFVKNVKYYQENKSMIIIGEEVESRRPITQQITIKAFLENTGLFTQPEIEQVINDPDRCRLFANQIRARRDPFKLVFDGTKSDADINNFFNAELKNASC